MTIQPLDAPERDLVPVGDWLPTRYTPTLTGSEVFRTDGDRLLKFGARHITIAEAAVLTLDVWQEWLIRHVLERYPDDWPVVHLRGQLRYRQVVISMGRQNGKSLLGVYLVLYLLCLHVRGPRVIGLASVDRQARIIYDRVRYAVENDSALERELRATGTRGIWRRDRSGVYMTLPAKEDSAQGEPASGVLADELHLMLAALWDAMVLAQKSKANSLLIGITTAGDDSSELLIRLYREGEAAIRGEDERFGFFLWEAAEDLLTEAGVIAANPGIACGRIPLDQTMADAWKMWNDHQRGPDGLTGRQRCIKYTLNRFAQGAADAWTNTAAWQNTTAADVDLDGAEVVFGIDRTDEWEWAAITATARAADGSVVTELVASIADPSLDLLADACNALAKGRRAVFTVDRRTLNDLGKRLERDGWTVYRLTVGEMDSASQYAHSRIARHSVHHPEDALVRIQSARGRRRGSGESGWRLSRVLSTGDVDAVMATIMGIYVTSLLDADDEPPIS